MVRDLDELLVRPLGSFILKGKAEAISIYEILGRRETATEEQRDLCDRFNSALDAYARADWSKAETMFESVLSAYPYDGPSMFYLERCKQYRTAPPQPEQATVVRMEFK